MCLVFLVFFADLEARLQAVMAAEQRKRWNVCAKIYSFVRDELDTSPPYYTLAKYLSFSCVLEWQWPCMSFCRIPFSSRAAAVVDERLRVVVFSVV